MKLLDGLDVLNVWRGSVSGDIGFVPTMGALHQGHMDLIGRSIRDNQQTIVSIFVNPMQFGPGEDLAKYPRPVEKDEDICRSLGVTALYRPSVHALYPLGFSTKVEVGGVQDAWCGARRPGHFAGVATVVLKLLNQISPRKLYLGQKDAQQVAVLKRMIRDLDLRTIVVVCPTIREADGLAMSSRNCFLGELEREFAPALYHTLRICVGAIDGGEQEVLVINEMFRNLLTRSGPWRLDYFGVADPETMQLVQRINRPVCLLSAAFLGATRLIDNVMAHVPKVD